MRVPSLAFFTLLPVLAIANTAQANEELPSTTPTLDGEDLATDNQTRPVTEIAAIPLTVEPAAPESLEFSQPQPLPTVSQEAASLEPSPAETVPEFTTIAPETAVPESTLGVEATAISPDVPVVHEDDVAIAPEPTMESELAPEFEPIEITISNAAALTTETNSSPAAAPIPSEFWELNASELDIAPTAMAKAEFADAQMMAVQSEKDCLKTDSAQLLSYQSAAAIAQRTVNSCYEPSEIEAVETPKGREYAASPALSIYIPVGYGADRNTGFVSTNYQSAVRPDANGSTFNAGLGVGLGNASKNVGVELSYALANNNDFGEGGFNVKVHRRLANDWAIAAGWNGLLNIGRNDFEHSKYGVVTKVVRLTPSLDDPLSRLSITAGVGDNQFRSNGAARAGDNNPNVFGNMALRVVRPVSLIAEWTGQDMGLGLSIAPFKRLPITITPAVRDLVTTDGRSARFVLGVGTAFRF